MLLEIDRHISLKTVTLRMRINIRIVGKGKMNKNVGINSVIGKNVTLGKNVIIKNNCVIEDNVLIGDNTVIDNNVVIRSNVVIGENSYVGANSVVGEYQMDYINDRQEYVHLLNIGDNAVIRSGTIIYGGSIIGNNFQTGHHVTIREDSEIGDSVSIGTLSDIQGKCKLGNYVRLHSNVHIGMHSQIDDCVWVFPYVVLTNDPIPPSEILMGCHIHSFAIIATGSILLPGVEVKSDSLIGAGTVVTRDVNEFEVVVGNPGKVKGDIRTIKDKTTGKAHYPWRYSFDRAMPWEGYGFDKWFSTLDEDTKKMFLGK